jgi:hypothetical protein
VACFKLLPQNLLEETKEWRQVADMRLQLDKATAGQVPAFPISIHSTTGARDRPDQPAPFIFFAIRDNNQKQRDLVLFCFQIADLYPMGTRGSFPGGKAAGA